MTQPAIQPDDEFTELVDAHITRVDLVDKAANGHRFLIAKQADGAAGLVDAGTVRGLIGKAEPAPERVTVAGSPAAIAKFIHDAAVRADTTDQTNAAGVAAADKETTVDKAEDTQTTAAEQKPAGDTTTATEAAATEKAAETTDTKADQDKVSLTKNELSDLLKDEITKATQPFKDALTRVEGELAKVMQTPQSGGPARTRTDHQTAVAKRAENLRAQISYLQEQVAVTGGDMQQGYRERLEKAEAALLELDGQP